MSQNIFEVTGNLWSALRILLPHRESGWGSRRLERHRQKYNCSWRAIVWVCIFSVGCSSWHCSSDGASASLPRWKSHHFAGADFVGKRERSVRDSTKRWRQTWPPCRIFAAVALCCCCLPSSMWFLVTKTVIKTDHRLQIKGCWNWASAREGEAVLTMRVLQVKRSLKNQFYSSIVSAVRCCRVVGKEVRTACNTRIIWAKLNHIPKRIQSINNTNTDKYFWVHSLSLTCRLFWWYLAQSQQRHCVWLLHFNVDGFSSDGCQRDTGDTEPIVIKHLFISIIVHRGLWYSLDRKTS